MSFFARQKAVVHVEGVVNIDSVLENCMLPLMHAGKRPVYLDFRKLRSITQTALNTLSKCYHALKNQGVICIFKNAPDEVAQYLIGEKKVDENHVREIRWNSKASLCYERGL